MTDGVLYGNFFLLGRLNRGGMAEVFLAKGIDRNYVNKLLAIKRMRTELSDDPDFVSMFSDEAKIARSLNHSNICRLFEQGRHANQLYLVMEFIHGKDLKVLRRRTQQRGEQIPPRLAALIVARIASALDYAHSLRSPSGEPEGIVHRDISPQNILLSYDGIPKLIDFGIAKARDRVAKTQVGMLKGKFAYMAPEQAVGQPVDSRSDLFSLGVVLYELLTNEAPFKGTNDFSTLQRIANCEYRPALEINPEIPRRLVQMVEKAMARAPAERYATGAALAIDLNSFLAEEHKPVNEATLSAFMRKLFRDDYIREMARIRDYMSVVIPARPRVAHVASDAAASAVAGAATEILGPAAENAAAASLAQETPEPAVSLAETTDKQPPIELLVPGAAQPAAPMAREATPTVSEDLLSPPALAIVPEEHTTLDLGKTIEMDLDQVNLEGVPLDTDEGPMPSNTTEEQALPFFTNTEEETIPVLRNEKWATHTPAHRSLTRAEVAVLIVAAVVGVAVVIGTYWYLISGPTP